TRPRQIASQGGKAAHAREPLISLPPRRPGPPVAMPERFRHSSPIPTRGRQNKAQSASEAVVSGSPKRARSGGRKAIKPARKVAQVLASLARRALNSPAWWGGA